MHMRVKQSKKSAYFSEEESEESSEVSYTCNQVKIPVQMHDIKNEISAISFPQIRTISWISSPVDNERVVISPSAVVPPVYISAHRLRTLVRELSGPVGSFLTLNLQLTSLPSLSEDDRDCLQRLVFSDSHSLFLQLTSTEWRRSEAELQSPIAIRSVAEEDLSYGVESISNLLANFDKSLCRGQEFKLLNCIRIRGSGQSHISETQRGHLLLRYEVVLPNYTFSCRRIHAVPMLSTPLSINLTVRRNARNPCSSGYLTLNQTRKLVIVPESDKATLAALPIIGAWASLDCELNTISHMLHHPIAWGACVRFLKSQYVKERLLLSDNTFLLVVFCATGVFYFEICRVSDRSHIGEYQYMDFTSDIAVEMDDDRSSDAVLCKFRPVVKSKRLADFRAALQRVFGESRLEDESVASSSAHRLLNYDMNNPSTASPLARSYLDIEAQTPQPRVSLLPQPSPSTPSPRTSISNLHAPPESVPYSLYEGQQRQIEMLMKKVEALQQEIDVLRLQQMPQEHTDTPKEKILDDCGAGDGECTNGSSSQDLDYDKTVSQVQCNEDLAPSTPAHVTVTAATASIASACSHTSTDPTHSPAECLSPSEDARLDSYTEDMILLDSHLEEDDESISYTSDFDGEAYKSIGSLEAPSVPDMESLLANATRSVAEKDKAFQLSMETLAVDADVPQTIALSSTVHKRKQTNTQWEESESIMMIQSKYM